MISAADLNRRVKFRRRSAVPTAVGTLRGGFSDLGNFVWAAFKEGWPQQISVGGFSMQGRSGTLTIRDNSWARGLGIADRAVIDGQEFEVLSAPLPVASDGALRLQVSSAPTRTLYEREADQRGEVITVRRYGGGGVVTNEVNVRAIVAGYEPTELVAGINQADRKVIIPARDLEASGFPLPLKPGASDRLVVRGRIMQIAEIDESTHRAAGVLNAYRIRAVG